MTTPVFQGRHVLVVGERLSDVATEGLVEARLETAPASQLDLVAQPPLALDLILIDAEAADPIALVNAINALAARPKAPAVLLAGAHMPAGLVRALMKLASSDVLEAPFTSVDLGRAAAALLHETQTAVQPANAHCWTVIGSVGGCGATTIAIEIASALAGRSGAEKRVALVDLNLVDGAAAAYLGATANMVLGDASTSPERIDAALLAAFASHIGPNLDLLAAPRDAKAFSRVSQTAVCRLLEVACQVYDWIVIDAPRHQQPWSLDVMSGFGRGAGGLGTDRAGAALGPRPRQRDRGRPARRWPRLASSSIAWPAACSGRRRRCRRPRRPCSARPMAASPPTGKRRPLR